jgi:hypothetical protein
LEACLLPLPEVAVVEEEQKRKRDTNGETRAFEARPSEEEWEDPQTYPRRARGECFLSLWLRRFIFHRLWGMEFGALVGDPSHYGDAQDNSNVPAKRGRSVDDPVALATSLEVPVEAAETGTSDGDGASVPFLSAPVALLTSRKRLKAYGAVYFYRRIRLSTVCAIFSGGFLRKPPLEIVFLETVPYENRL